MSATPSSFAEWLDAVDRVVIGATGLSVHDADCCFADWYEDGLTPRQAARHAIRSECE